MGDTGICSGRGVMGTESTFACNRKNMGRLSDRSETPSARASLWKRRAAPPSRQSKTEVAFHRAAELKEVGWKAEEVSPYIDYLADFRHEFHDIRGDPDFVDCLDPNNYTASQTLGLKLLTS